MPKNKNKGQMPIKYNKYSLNNNKNQMFKKKNNKK